HQRRNDNARLWCSVNAVWPPWAPALRRADAAGARKHAFFRPGTFRSCAIGTTFWSMPIRGTPQAEDDAEPALAVPLILLVEDDFVLRSSLSELLVAEGFRVECAADGREALRRLDRL